MTPRKTIAPDGYDWTQEMPEGFFTDDGSCGWSNFETGVQILPVGKTMGFPTRWVLFVPGFGLVNGGDTLILDSLLPSAYAIFRDHFQSWRPKPPAPVKVDPFEKPNDGFSRCKCCELCLPTEKGNRFGIAWICEECIGDIRVFGTAPAKVGRVWDVGLEKTHCVPLSESEMTVNVYSEPLMFDSLTALADAIDALAERVAKLEEAQ